MSNLNTGRRIELQEVTAERCASGQYVNLLSDRKSQDMRHQTTYSVLSKGRMEYISSNGWARYSAENIKSVNQTGKLNHENQSYRLGGNVDCGFSKHSDTFSGSMLVQPDMAAVPRLEGR